MLGNLYVAINTSAAAFTSEVRKVQRESTELQRSLRPIGKAMADVGRAATAAGGALTAALTLPLAAIGTVAVKAATEFESSFAGVRKTIDATEKEFAALSDGIRAMSKELPVSVNELNAIAEAAGQLGIKKEDILAFTRTMADLGATTNLTSDQAATATAQIQNIFGQAGKDVDRFGSTLVALGNAGASTEADIINMGLRIAGAGVQVGLSQAQVLSFSSALSSVGISAEAGGSAISRVFLKINDAVASGGGTMDEFARVAGMSSAAFKEAFETNAAGATTAFISGLNRVKGEGENVNATLEGLIGKNIVIKDTLLRAAGAGSLLADQLAIGDRAWQENTALVNEAAQRYRTFESQFATFKNQLNDVAISIGQALLPVLTRLLDNARPLIGFISDAAHWFGALSPTVQTVGIAIAAVAAAVGPLLLGFGFIATSFAGLIPVIVQVAGYLGITAAGGGLTGALAGVVGFLTGPVGIAVAIGAAVVALGTFLASNEEVVAAVGAVWNEWGPSVTAMFRTVWNTVSTIFTTAWTMIKTVLSGNLDIIVGVIQVFSGVLTGDWTTFTAGIKNIWEGLWTSVKAVLTGPLDVIKNTVKSMTDSVTSSFAGMYDAIIGHSYVPDMISGIRFEFGKLPEVMVNPATTAVEKVKNSFSDMFRAVTSKATEWGNSLMGVFNAIGGKAGSIANQVIGGIKTIASVGSKFASGDVLGGVLEGASALINTFKNFVGQGRRTANEFVQTIQNPFGNKVIGIIDAFNAAAAAGTLTKTEARSALSEVENLWRSFGEQANEFARQGSTQAKVVEQAFTTLSWIPDHALPGMEDMIASLTDAVTEAVDSGGMLTDTLGESGMGLTDAFSQLTEAGNLATTAIDELTNGLGSLVDAVGNALEGISETLADALANLRIVAESPDSGGGSGRPPTTTVPPTGGTVPPAVTVPIDPFWGQIDALRRANGGLPELDTGLVRVPRTMAAIIHQDEAVLKPSEARDWRAGKSGNTTTVQNHTPITIYVNESKNPQATADAVARELERRMKTNQGSFGNTVRNATKRNGR